MKFIPPFEKFSDILQFEVDHGLLINLVVGLEVDSLVSQVKDSVNLHHWDNPLNQEFLVKGGLLRKRLYPCFVERGVTEKFKVLEKQFVQILFIME